MIVINKGASWHPVSIPAGVQEGLSKDLLEMMGWDCYSIPEDSQDVVREPAIRLIDLLHDEYVHGNLYNDDLMEWVSTDEQHTMLLFGGHIIMTSKTVEQDAGRGTFKDVVRWFGGQQFTLTHEDI